MLKSSSKKKTEKKSVTTKAAKRKFRTLLKSKKFWLRLALYFIFAIFIILLSTQLLLRYIVSSEYVKKELTQIVSGAINNSNVQIASITANLKGFEIKDVNICTDDGEILYVSKIIFRPQILPLLRGRIEVRSLILENVNLHIVRNQDGTFNFEKLITPSAEEPAPQQDDADSKFSVLDIRVKTAQITGSTIYFLDKQENSEVKLSNTFLDISRFNFYKPFRTSFNTSVSFKQGAINVPNLELGLNMDINLAGMELNEAQADLKLFVAEINESFLAVKGNVENFANPRGQFTVNTKKFVSESFEDIINVPAFDFSSLKLSTSFASNLSEGEISIDKFDLETVFSTANAHGELTFGGPKLTYAFNINSRIILDNIPQAVPMASDYKPTGNIVSEMTVSDANIGGNISFEQIGFFTPQAGTLKDFNSKINMTSISKMTIPSLSGKLNGNSFRAKADYELKADTGHITLSFNSDRFLMRKTAQAVAAISDDPVPPPVNKTDAKKEPVTQADATSASIEAKAKDDNFNLPPLHIKADIFIGDLDSPFIRAQMVRFNADVENVTLKMDKTQGIMTLSTQKGEIKDLYKLTNANAITKVLFMSVGIISRVINTLNVLDILQSLVPDSKAERQAKKEAKAADKAQKMDGKMNFDSFITSLTFTSGKTDIKQGSFVSDLLSFKLQGNMDFNTRALNMKVNAAPGRHYDDGIMPLTINIGGTIENPEGKMSVFSSTTSLVKQLLLNNFVSNAVKGGALSIVDTVTGNSQVDTRPAGQQVLDQVTEAVPNAGPLDSGLLREPAAVSGSK